MPVPAAQRDTIRRLIEEPTAEWSKAQADAAIEAVETWFQANRAGIAAEINTATSPFVIPNPVKDKIVKHWLRSKFDRE